MQKSCDVLIVTALLDELEALESVREFVIDGWRRTTTRRNLTSSRGVLQCSDGSQLTIIAAWLGGMGETVAASAATSFMRELAPTYLAMCGICGGNPGEVHLGDVIIADRVYSYDSGKLIASVDQHGMRVEELRHEIVTHNLHSEWRNLANQFVRDPKLGMKLNESRPVSLAQQQMWLIDTLHVHEHGKGVAPSEHPLRAIACPSWEYTLGTLEKEGFIVGRFGRLQLTSAGKAKAETNRLLYPEKRVTDPPFRVHVGAIATGKTVREDPELFGGLVKLVRGTLGVDMEAAAIGHVANEFNVPAIIVKGATDYADSRKDDSFRTFAASAAATVLLQFLRRVGAELRREQTAQGPAPIDDLSAQLIGAWEIEMYLPNNGGVVTLARITLTRVGDFHGSLHGDEIHGVWQVLDGNRLHMQMRGGTPILPPTLTLRMKSFSRNDLRGDSTRGDRLIWRRI